MPELKSHIWDDTIRFDYDFSKLIESVIKTKLKKCLKSTTIDDFEVVFLAIAAVFNCVHTIQQQLEKSQEVIDNPLDWYSPLSSGRQR
jgi:hypothetical protein